MKVCVFIYNVQQKFIYWERLELSSYSGVCLFLIFDSYPVFFHLFTKFTIKMQTRPC